jgi:hypothetical protein
VPRAPKRGLIEWWDKPWENGIEIEGIASLFPNMGFKWINM